jgi:hypothetical protein
LILHIALKSIWPAAFSLRITESIAVSGQNDGSYWRIIYLIYIDLSRVKFAVFGAGLLTETPERLILAGK